MRRTDLVRSRRPRAAAGLAALTVAVLTLTGCQSDSGGSGDEAEGPDDSSDTGSDSDGDPAETLQDAVSQTLEQRAFSIDSELDLDIGEQNLRLEIEGRVDYDATIADVMLGVSQTGGESLVTVLADGETFWIDVDGPQAPPFPDGADWLEGDTVRLAESTTFNPAGLLGTILVLRGAEDVEEVDSDDVDGVEVTRYAATFTYDDASAAVSGEEAEILSNAFSLTGAASALELDAEVLVGEDGVIREVDLEIADQDEVPAQGGYDLELTDVGEEVDAPDAPDPDDVASGPEVEALLDQLVT